MASFIAGSAHRIQSGTPMRSSRARFVLGAVAVAMTSTSCNEAIVSARSRQDGFTVLRARCVGLST
jgi:hypothetical protein